MTERLFAETLGSGDDVVLLHGWGMSSRFMRPFAEALAARYRVSLFDLPGHGCSGMLDAPGLEGMVPAMLEQAPPRAHWVGWSLGALVALQVAGSAPQAVRSLCLLAGSPRFVAAPDWPGVDGAVFGRFAADLRRDYARTIERFLSLQLHGMDDERTLLRALRDTVSNQDPPAQAALVDGLAILRETDLRGVARALDCPLLMLLGRRDRLIPAAVGSALLELNPRAVVRIFDDAAHLPFWTHREATRGAVEDFFVMAGSSPL